MANLSIHEKINVRSHFESEGSRARVPYSDIEIRRIMTAGHSISYFISTPYGVRVDGTVFNKRGGNLKN